MKKSKKKRSAPFSGLSVMKKFVFFDIMMIAAIISVGTIMVATVMNGLTDKSRKRLVKPHELWYN